MLKYSLLYLSRSKLKTPFEFSFHHFLLISEDFGGHGNSFHGTGGRGNKRGQMRHCLRLLRSVVSTGDEAVLQDLSDQGVINQLVSKYSCPVLISKPIDLSYILLQFKFVNV